MVEDCVRRLGGLGKEGSAAGYETCSNGSERGIGQRLHSLQEPEEQAGWTVRPGAGCSPTALPY